MSVLDAAADDRLAGSAEREVAVLAAVRELDLDAAARRIAEQTIGCTLPTRHGAFRALACAPDGGGAPIVALVHGDPAATELPLVSVHVACLLGETFGSLACSCRGRLHSALEAVVAAGAGAVVYLTRPVGAPLACSAEAPVAAGAVAGLLRAVGLARLRLHDPHPVSPDALAAHGLEVQ